MMNWIKEVRISAAHGEAAFPMERGSFLYDDSITQKSELALTEEAGTSGGWILSDMQGMEQGRLYIQAEKDRQTLRFHLNDPWWNRFYLEFPTDPEEHYYGCGETFSEFDLKGQRVRIWVAEHQNIARIEEKLKSAANSSEAEKLPFDRYESYYAQPTFVTSLCRYLHIDTSAFTAFDFRESGKIGIELWEEAQINVEEADSFPALSCKLSQRLGRIPALPSWSGDGIILGMQQGPEVIDRKLEACRAHGVPVAGIWSQDWCGCRRTGFGYQVMWNWEADETLYPHLPEKIAQWKAQGIRFLGYINPFMAIEKDLYSEASEKGYCVKDKDGADYLVTITTFPAAMIDLTNPDAYAWYKEVIRKNMIDIGMGGWMADFGEYLPTDAVLFEGSDPMKIHNRWPAIWARLNREAIEEAGKTGEVFFFTRAGFTQTIRYSTMMWNGDQHVDWSADDGIASVIPATLSLAMSGYGLTHSDVGGYTTMQQMTREKELLMRWEEMNAFSPLMRSHEGNQPSRNVQFDADGELLDHLSRCAGWFKALKPYLRECMHEEESAGTPVIRPLFYHYDEPEAYTEGYEYLLGRDILVAPVLEKGAAERLVYLPEDEWTHLFTGQDYEGGYYKVYAPAGMPPVFIRKDAVQRPELKDILALCR